MRDILLLAIVAGGCVVALYRPWFGAILWTWLSVMNPSGMAYGFSRTLPLAAMAAGATMIGMLFEKHKRWPFIDSTVTWFMLFLAWICIRFPFSFDVDGSADMLVKMLKIDLMLLVTLALLQTRQHIDWFVSVMVISIGFYAVKGGVFTITTGGAYRVWGPGGFIGGNNEIALAIIMIIPLMRYLQLQQTRRWARHAFTLAMLLSATAALGSQSRGALLGLAAMALYLLIKGRRQALFGIAIVAAAALLIAFMPESWDQRMATIGNYEQDESARNRINAWTMVWNLAVANVFGGGFAIYSHELFAIYAPDPSQVHVAHSIYFSVLGEQGFVGLALFLGMWAVVWKGATELIRVGQKKAELTWCKDLGAMCQVSLVGYLVGGAFLSLAYFDLPYNILALVALTRSWVRSNSSTQAPNERHGTGAQVTGRGDQLGYERDRGPEVGNVT